MFGRIAAALQKPSDGQTWLQLAAMVIFMITVAIAWRQTTFYIMGEK